MPAPRCCARSSGQGAERERRQIPVALGNPARHHPRSHVCDRPLGRPSRRGARAAEWAGFENQLRRKLHGGSNPPLSATSSRPVRDSRAARRRAMPAETAASRPGVETVRHGNNSAPKQLGPETTQPRNNSAPRSGIRQAPRTQAAARLWLLPSGPDQVHAAPLSGTRQTPLRGAEPRGGRLHPDAAGFFTRQVENWRRGGDSNPRRAFGPYSLSKRAP